MTNKAATEKKTELYCNHCKMSASVRHPRYKDAKFCPTCGEIAVVESIQVVMPQ